MIQRGLLLIATLALVAASCTSDTAEVVETDVEAPSEVDRCRQDPGDPSCADYLESLSDDEFCELVPDDEFCAEEPAAPEEPASPEGDDLRSFCVEDPGNERCDEFFESLSDEEFCELVPDDEFCAEEPAAPEEPASTEDDDLRSFCVEDPGNERCDEFFESLSDEEFCELVPDDDEFCADLLGSSGAVDEEPDDDTADGGGESATADPTLVRDDGLCLPDDDAAGDPAGIDFALAYQVVDGRLGAPCFGSGDPTVEWAWQVLVDFVPPDQLFDLAVFGGFNSSEDADGVTLAFVQPLDDDGTLFLMAVNVEETRNDENEAVLTMAHEFAHVITLVPSEIDRGIFPEDCPRFDNGDGCLRPESILNQWFDTFWQNAPGDPTDESGADERCDLDAGFFGNYAASTPDEDFAEAFSAYVFGVEAATPGQQARLDWIDAYPGLREFRERASERGYGPLPNSFDRCG